MVEIRPVVVVSPRGGLDRAGARWCRPPLPGDGIDGIPSPAEFAPVAAGFGAGVGCWRETCSKRPGMPPLRV